MGLYREDGEADYLFDEEENVPRGQRKSAPVVEEPQEEELIEEAKLLLEEAPTDGEDGVGEDPQADFINDLSGVDEEDSPPYCVICGNFEEECGCTEFLSSLEYEDPDEEDEVPDPLKMLIYSPAGHGKTFFCGTVIDTYSREADMRIWPFLLIDFEGGKKSIKSKTRALEVHEVGRRRPKPGKIDVVRIRKWEDFDYIYAFLESKRNWYRGVGLDSLSEMNYLNLQTVVEGRRPSKIKSATSSPEQNDYGVSGAQMRKLIRFFRDLPIHTILTAGTMDVTDARTKRPQVRPSLVGKLANEIPGIVDTVGYLAIVEDGDETYRCLFVQPREGFMAKDRSEGGTLGDYVSDPTLPKVLDILYGEVDQEEYDEE